MKSLDKACPSATCDTGAAIIGIINPEGYVSMLPQKIDVTDEFIEITSQGTAPEKRFRFTNKCVEGGCRQWDGSRCTVIDRIIKNNDAFYETPLSNLPACSIRSNCRWFHQASHQACMACPFIITDNIPSDQERIYITETQELIY